VPTQNEARVGISKINEAKEALLRNTYWNMFEGFGGRGTILVNLFD
jgi:hypothetical protein